MSAATRWTLVIVGLLVGNVAMMGVLIAASTSSRPAIIPEYYDRAVAYDRELDDAERSRTIGWQVKVTLGRDDLEVELRTRDGARIPDARVSLAGFQRAHASERFELALVATDGTYRARRELRLGVYDVEIVVERGGERFVARQTLEVR